MSIPIRKTLLLSLLLFGVNVYICRELFSIEFLNNLSSNDGAFIALARFYQKYGTGHGWFPWFNAGMPIENAYQPLLPAAAAFAARLSGWPIARAFHFVLATAYCAGPVTLFWFAWEWSRSLTVALIAGLTYSLTSPAELLAPVLRVPFGSHWGGLRLYNLIHYAEDPHIAALTLLPLALLFLHRAIMRRTAAACIAAVLSCASVVATNAFGAVDLAIGALCIVLALNAGALLVLPIGLAAYFLISPWLPPSLLDLMRHDQWGARGYFHSGIGALLSAVAVLAVFALLWVAGRSLKSTLERFSMLFAFWMCIIPLGYFLLNLTLVPQGHRYQLEMEMALCLGFACLCAHLPWRAAVITLVVLAGIRQTIVFRQYARTLVQPVNVTRTIEYKVDKWIDGNLPRKRTMISGDAEYLFNVFSDNPQMIGGHEPTAPNWEQLVAVYVIYTGTNAGDRDAEYSILWLKAFGNQAIYVAGDKSREFYHAVAHPHKFDGLLQVLWHDEDDTIFAVPQRSGSLAHVIPPEAVVARAPIHGLDVNPIRPYVAALDNPALPLAEFTWLGTSRALIRAPLKSGQLVSVQMNYAPGWRAYVGSREIPVCKDGIGLLVLEPGCNGPCEVRLNFDATTEVWICRCLSVAVTLVMVCIAVTRTLAALRIRRFTI